LKIKGVIDEKKIEHELAVTEWEQHVQNEKHLKKKY
jgi:hypothetical protein